VTHWAVLGEKASKQRDEKRKSMKEVLSYQPPQLRRRFNAQFVAGFSTGFIVGMFTSAIFAVIAVVIFRSIE
jgi:hypothetical protein